jgi:putative ABC transport system permease protein
MFRNYLKTAFRNLLRQKLTTIINVLCMSIAISCSLIAYLFTFDNLQSEWFHTNASTIFMVEHKAIEEGDLETFGNVPTPLAPALLQDHSFIVNAVRITDAPVTIHKDAQVNEEWVRFADPSFFDMFTFPLEAGDPKSLAQKNTVILSQNAAVRYFGNVNPVGKTLELEFAPDDKAIFTVTGVTKPMTGPSSCAQFTVLLNYENAFRKNPSQLTDWNHFSPGTFIQVDNPARIAELKGRMQPYIALQNKADKASMPVQEFAFQNLLELAGDPPRNSIVGEVSWAPIIVLGAISTFLLLLASFNCINVNIASVALRLKEIGIRKVIGGTKKQLVFQFLTENMLVCLGSFVVAIALTGSVLFPAFEEITTTGLKFDLMGRIDIWIYLLLLFVGVAICSGLYPALYISSFQPIAILRDKVRLGGKNNFTRILLTTQFVIAFINIIGSVGLTVNYYDMQSRDWGYKKDNLMTLRAETPAQYSLMKKTAEEQPNMIETTSASRHVGFYNDNGTMIRFGELKTNAIVYQVATNYFDVMGFEVLSGKLPASSDAVVVNEKFASQFGWANGVGETIMIDSNRYSIAAIVKDFHHDDFAREINSVVFTIGKEEAFTNVVMRIENNTGPRTRSALETTWKKNFGEAPFALEYQEDTFNEMYAESAGILRIFMFTTGVALFMSCIGLFGLASQRVQFKRKEICIRKIFGVPLVKAVLLVNGNFILLIGIAAVIASPLSYMILDALLDSIYRYRMEVNASPFLISFALMGITILITLSGKIVQIAKTNPANILRNE